MDKINVQALCVIVFTLLALGSMIYRFIRLSQDQKIANVKEWLKWAVTMAEKELGSGTGQLKLRQVYNMAISEFPWIVQVISFELFSKWVDEALEWMESQLESNKAIQELVS